MHRWMLVGEQSTWYRRDVLPAFAAAFTTGYALHFVLPELNRGLSGAMNLAFATLAIGMAALLAAREVRGIAASVAMRVVKILTGAPGR